MRTKDIVIWVTTAAFTVVVVILLIVGIVKHDEPTFLDDTYSWSRAAFPLKVRGQRYIVEGAERPNRSQREALDQAVDVTNQRLGFEALTWAELGSSADIVVDMGVPPSETWEAAGGHFALTGTDEEYQQCVIYTANTGTQDVLFWVLQHELGHCLGLAHDDFSRSIMYRSQWTVDDFRDRPWITDADRAAIREKYVP